jgi:hypothetical protein
MFNQTAFPVDYPSLLPRVSVVRNGKTQDSNPFFEWTPPELSPLLVTPTEAFSANPAIEPSNNTLNQAISLGNLFSSDLSKSLLNLWRQGLMPIARRLDSAFRGVAQVPMQYIQEQVRQSARSHIAPLVTAELFPKINGKTLTKEDRSLYLHLEDKAFNELQQLDEQYGVLDVEKMGGLYDALTDTLRGGRYAKIPELVHRFTLEVPVLDAQKQPTGRFQTVKFAPNSALVTHLKWKLAAKESLQDIQKNYDLLNPAKQYVPFLQFDSIAERSVERVGEQVLLAHNHVDEFGLIKHVPTLYQFLLQASRGDFTTATGEVNLSLAFDVFSGDLHKEKIDDELPLILGGEGSTPAKLRQMVLKAWVVKLFKTCEALNPEQKTNARFGKTADVQVLWKNLWRHLKQGGKDTDPKAFEQKVTAVVEQLFSEHILLKNDDPNKPETLLSYPFKLDAKNELGLHQTNGVTFAKESAKALWELQKVLNECFDMTTHGGKSAQDFQDTAKKLLVQFQQHNQALALTFPGTKTSEGERAALRYIHGYWSLEQEGKISDNRKAILNLMQLLDESQHLTKFRLPAVVKASTLPQLAISMVAGLLVTGVFWNYMDNNVIQPYENKMMEKKGSVEYTGLVLGAAFVPAFAAFVGMSKWDVLKRLTGNKPALQFGISGLLGLALQAGLSTAMVRAFLELKPDAPKHTTPTTPGTINAKVDFNLGNLSPKFQQDSLVTMQKRWNTINTATQWQPLAKQLPYTVAAITEPATTN